MVRYKFFVAFVLLFYIWISAFCQENSSKKKPIQISGIVINDTLAPLAFAHIYVINKNLGAITNFEGYFSFATEPGDTLIFSYVGYKNTTLVIPDSNKTTDLYDTIHLEIDPVLIAEVKIFPWSTFEQFKEAFLNLDIPDDDIERAKKNIELIKIQTLAYNSMPDAKAAYLNYQQHVYTTTFNQGLLYPTTNLFNPFAWAQYFDMLKKKREEK